MRILVFLLAMLVAAAAAAQSTRVETIAGQQAEKAKALGREGPSEAEMIIRRVLLSPLLNGGDGIYPWFGSVYSGTGMGVGVGFLKRMEKAAYINLHTGLSLNNSMMMRGTFAAPGLWHGKLQVDATAQWLNARGVSFYGLGQDSSREARTRFDYTPTELGGTATLKPMRFVSMTGSYSFLSIDTELDTPGVPAAAAPGLNQSLQFHVSRATAMLDWRPAPGYSTRGGFYRASFERSLEAEGRPFSFTAQEYEVMQQVPLVREHFVLAGRALMTLTQAHSHHEVPVMMAPFLGSGSALRGYANRRFTDRNRVLLSGEYRWRPSRYLDMALFIDGGQVAARRQEFDLGAFDVAWGVGARFHGPTFNALRVELARGREGIRLIVSGSQPF